MFYFTRSHRFIASLRAGQGLVEYALLIALIGIVVIVILTSLGGTVGNVFSNITCSLEECQCGASACVADASGSSGDTSGTGDSGDSGGSGSSGDTSGTGDSGDSGGSGSSGDTSGTGDSGDSGGSGSSGDTSGTGDSGDSGGSGGSGDTSGTGDSGDSGGSLPGSSGGSGNTPPSLNSIGDQTLNEGVTQSITLVATDGEDDSLSFTATGIQPAFMNFTDNGNSTATLSLTPGLSHAGNYPILVSVNDGNAGVDSEFFTVAIIDYAPDTDADGIPDSSDNCPSVANASQTNRDNDSSGDACDTEYHINVGATTPTGPDSEGNMWMPGFGLSSSSGGTVSQQTVGNNISDTSDDFLYRTQVYASSGSTGRPLDFDITGLPNGTYTVILHFAEYNGSQRSRFDVYVQDVRRQNNYRPYTAAGNHTYDAVEMTVNNMSVTDGSLSISLTPEDYAPILNGIEIIGT